MDRYKLWSGSVIILIFALLFPIARYNFYMDPLWNFSHSHEYNNDQMPFDERQQKTNHLTFTSECYNNLLIGSSRATYINQYDFPTATYNYAVSNILLHEYPDFIAYAAKKNGAFETVYLALDFFATNKNIVNPKNPQEYIKTANTIGYRWTTLLSRDVYEYSRRNYQASLEKVYPVNFAYSRTNVKRLLPVSPEETQRLAVENLIRYKADFYGNYSYGDVVSHLKQIQKEVPGSHIVAFTTPVSPALFQLMLDMGLYPFYEQWIMDIVHTFGEVYHFMYPNQVTEDWNNFFDASHVYPSTNTLIVRTITGQYTTPGFGMHITVDNLEESLNYLRGL